MSCTVGESEETAKDAQRNVKELSVDCRMANTLHYNMVVKSKLNAPTETEDKLTLLKNNCGQAKRGFKS